jgi:hypothetical protein
MASPVVRLHRPTAGAVAIRGVAYAAVGIGAAAISLTHRDSG